MFAALAAALAPAPARPPSRILAAFTALAAALALAGCAASTRTGPAPALAPDLPERRVVLVFEDGNSFRPLAGRAVRILLSSPAALLSPVAGEAATGPEGSVEVVYRPVAVYDRTALAAGDVVADFPAVLFVSMNVGGEVFEWQVDDTLTFARYRDPLYQGLDRDPAPGPSYINLYLP